MSNQDWLDDLLRKLWDSGYHTALAEPFDNLTVPEAKAAILTKLAQELKSIIDLPGASHDDIYYAAVKRIAELEAALKGDSSELR